MSKKYAAELRRGAVPQTDHFKWVAVCLVICFYFFLKKQITTHVETQEQFSDKNNQSRFVIDLFLKKSALKFFLK